MHSHQEEEESKHAPANVHNFWWHNYIQSLENTGIVAFL